MKIFRSNLWKYLLAAVMAVAVYISFVTPIGGYLQDVATLKMSGSAEIVPVKAILARAAYDSAGSKYILASDDYNTVAPIHVQQDPGVKAGDVFVADLTYNTTTKGIDWVQLVRVNPTMTFPLIPGLGELGRNMLFHVPMSMVAFIAFLFGTINSLLYLLKKRTVYDERARAHSVVGFLFTLLATITGSIWARFSWGSFWNWDPRETSIFILLLVYMAYFILRSLLEEGEEKKARIAAVYNIIAFASVPFLMFVMPRITQSLHPGGGGTEAPVINTSGKTHTAPQLQMMLWTNVFLFAMVYVWMKDVYARLLHLEEKEEV